MKTFENVRVDAKANIYFDGKVVSHTVIDQNGKKLTLGLIYPGAYKFNTGVAERMSIIAGACRVLLANGASSSHEAGSSFVVPANSAFTIIVSNGICEYICDFL